jgi:hypothetical protein
MDPPYQSAAYSRADAGFCAGLASHVAVDKEDGVRRP